MTEKIIKIKLLAYKGSDLLMASSDDLEGLHVQGRSIQEIERLLPTVIRALLEARGQIVENVSLLREKEDESSDFVPPALIASASFIAAAQ